MNVEVIFAPAELPGLERSDLTETACVVFDVLRATSTMVTALANGARAIRPVSTIDEALEEHAHHSNSLLAGERGGLRIGAELARGRSFDFGNSPREFSRERVAGKTIIMTTTNGTRAIRSCARAAWVAVGSFLNLTAVISRLRARKPGRVLLVCSGTGETISYEDVLGAGALCADLGDDVGLDDSARIARAAWRHAGTEWKRELGRARNAARLQAIPDLAADLEFCTRRDAFPIVPVLRQGTELTLDEAGGSEGSSQA